MRALALAGLVLLAGCGDTREAKQMVAANFRDPDSLQWRNVSATTDFDGRHYVCGEVNGRNLYGAYTGYRRFVFDADRRTVEIEPGPQIDEGKALYELNVATFNLASTACDF